MTVDTTTVGEELRAQRLKRRETLGQFSCRLYISIGYLSDIERGARALGLPNAARFESVLGLPPGYLVQKVLTARLAVYGLDADYTVVVTKS